MSTNPQIINPPPKRRRWLRRILRTFGIGLLVVLIFHRPIVHHGGRWVAIRVARSQNIDLDLRIGGNLWSGIEITGIRAQPLGSGPSPIERLSLDRLRVDYRLWPLVRGDLTGLRTLEIGRLDAVIDPAAMPSQPRKKQGQPLAEALRAVLSKPLPAPGIRIKSVNVRVREKRADIAVSNFHLTAIPGEPGAVGWAGIELPGASLPAFEATTDYGTGRLRVLNPSAEFLSLTATTNGVDFSVALPTATLSLRAAPTASGDRISAALKLAVMDGKSFASTLGIALPVLVSVPSVEVKFDGAPENPESWKSSVAIRVETSASEKIPAVNADFRFSFEDFGLKNGTVRAEAAGVVFEGSGDAILKSLLTRSGGAALPDSAAFQFRFSGPDLKKLGSLIPEIIAGRAEGSGIITMKDGAALFSLVVEADALAMRDQLAERVEIRVNAAAPARADVALRDVTADASIVVKGAGAGTLRVDEVRAKAALAGSRATVSELRVSRGSGAITVSGSAMLTPAGGRASEASGRFDVRIPAMEDFQFAVKDTVLAGVVNGEGTFAFAGSPEKSAGRISLHASGLKLGREDVGRVDVELALAEGVLRAEKCVVQLPGRAEIAADGTFTLAEPQGFAGKLRARVPDLAAFRPMLAALGVNHEMGGSIDLLIDGSGDAAKPQAVVKLSAKGVKFDALRITDAGVSGVIRPDSAEISELFVVNERMRVNTKAAWSGERIDLSGLDVRLDGSSVVSGMVSVPFRPREAKPFPPDAPLSAGLNVKDLDLAKLLSALGLPAGPKGQITATLESFGTLEKPRISFTVKADGLAVPGPEGIPPTALEARATFENDEVNLAGTIRQPLVQPVKFSASSRLKMSEVIDGRMPLPSEIPLAASLEMPSSPLSFLPRLVPAIARIDGTAGISVKVSGNAAKPVFQGGVNLDIRTARFADPAIPALSAFKSRIDATGDRVRFTEFSGEAGGGRFAVTGAVDISNPAVPVFDVALKSKDVLVLRDDSIVVRAETDVALRGPLNSARVSGAVFVVQSRFQKDIEILPLALPGKPKPVPAAVAKPITVSFPNPPLRDWTFDVTVKTRENDPFLVRSNLARGKASIDLRLLGTGRAPYLTGAISIDQFSATLPVSTLTTRRGLITFTENSPFQPRVEIEAESKVRQYLVIARVDGPASKPRLELESEPPLPQQEILSLLATGSLTGEIGANNTAMATRAAVLVVKGWYKKIFKKDFPIGSGNEDGDSIMDRFEVDFGAIDPKTGRNEATAQFRVTERLFFIGDLEFGGGFSGRVKYLFRFY